MKFSHNHYRVPPEQCECRVVRQDQYMRVVWDKCFRCTVMEAVRERHRRIEMVLTAVFVVLHIGAVVFTVGFDRGWW